MPKPVVDARQVLQDLGAGMSDSDLMAKYSLTRKGLESLIKKLMELGLVRQLSAKDLLRDIGAGVGYPELMKKHNLTPRGLERLLKAISESGMRPFRERFQEQKKGVSVSEIVRDVRAGLSEGELMRRHGLSSRGLQSAFWKLVQSGVLTWEELLSALPGADLLANSNGNRRSKRTYPILSIKVYEEGKSKIPGKVKDLTENGLGVLGLRAEVGQRKTLVLVPDKCTDIKPFRVQVECKWFRGSGDRNPCSCGFEITTMEVEGFERLQELIQLTTLVFE